MKKKRHTTGFTIVEFLFAMALGSVIVLVVGFFARDIFRLNGSAQSSMNSLLEGRRILSVMVAELRSTSPSALGSYSIESASTSTIIFFADVNSDNISDRIRYFLHPATRSVQRGVVLATGEPPGYNLGAETFSTLITDISNGTSTPIFEYFPASYTGTSSPLSVPVDITAIRLVKIIIKIERDPTRSPELTTLTSQATLRNLKDNL
jgi:hypothetical protein